MAVWSSGMIPASGAGGPEFDPRNGPNFCKLSTWSAALLSRHCIGRLATRSHSSVGQSVWLITIRSAVRARVGPLFLFRVFVWVLPGHCACQLNLTRVWEDDLIAWWFTFPIDESSIGLVVMTTA